MSKLGIWVVLAVAMLFCAAGAKADQFELTATGTGGTTIDLSLTGSAIGSGVFDITSASGTVDGISAGLLSAGAILNDNLLYTGSPYFDLLGLGLVLSNGAVGGIHGAGTGDFYLQFGPNGIEFSLLSVQVTEAPEPGTLALIAAGLVAVLLLSMRKLIA